jgi:hypothetical protein
MAKSQKLFQSSRFQPQVGGHAPGDLREAFCEAVESRSGTDPDPLLMLRGQYLRLSQIAGAPWNCTDMMPSGVCNDIGVRLGGSYAIGARYIRALVNSE